VTTVFLSYAHGDDEAFVRRLHDDLVRHGHDVWWDRVSMPNRALTFLHEIRDAIAGRDRLLLVVGPKALASDYVSAEWRFALESGKAINPVLRLGDYTLLPEELKLLDTLDFRRDEHHAAGLTTLLRQIAEPVAPMGKLVAVPALPPHFLHQPERVRALKDTVLADLQRPVVVTGTAARTGIHGMGGIGKSVLAAAFARDTQVRRAFADGIIWVPVGQQPDLVGLQRDIAHALGDAGHFESLYQGKAHLNQLLADRAALLILDDLWQAGHAEAFDILGPRCRLLVTTRDAALITALGGTQHQVELLTESQGLRLLADWAEHTVEALPPAARAVLAECGRLPLALTICGAMVRDGMAWGFLLEALRQASLEYLDHPHGNVLRSIKVGVDALTPEQRQRFAELAVFSPDEKVPEAAVAVLWAHTGGLEERHTHQLLTVLKQRSLMQIDVEAPHLGQARQRRVSLHDLLYDYALRLTGDRLLLHQRLLAAYRHKCPAGWPSGLNDGYFFQHLRHHLIESGRVDELVDLLVDLSWLEAKTTKGLVFDLAADYAAASEVMPRAHPRAHLLPLLDEAVRRDVHFIARHAEDYPQGLFQCLWNSCWWYDSPQVGRHYYVFKGRGTEPFPWQRAGERLSGLLEEWRRVKEHGTPGFVWLRSLRPPISPLRTALKGILRKHEDNVTSVAWSPDGRRVVSGSSDRTIRVWDVTNGAELLCLSKHEGSVNAVAWSPDGRRVISGSDDQTVRVWDAATGAELLSLPGHGNRVKSVSCSPDGQRLVSGSADCTVRVWDTSSGTQLRCLSEHEKEVTSVSFSSDGRYIVSGGDDGTVRVWDAATGAQLRCLRGHTGWVWSVSFSPDGKQIVSGGGYDGTVRVWDAASGSQLLCLRKNGDWVQGVAFSPDGRYIANGSWDCNIRVWDAARGTQILCFAGHENIVRSVAYSPDGRQLVSGSQDRTVRVWDVAPGLPVFRLKGHKREIQSVFFSALGRRVVSADLHNGVHVWDASTGTHLGPRLQLKTIVGVLGIVLIGAGSLIALPAAVLAFLSWLVTGEAAGEDWVKIGTATAGIGFCLAMIGIALDLCAPIVLVEIPARRRETSPWQVRSLGSESVVESSPVGEPVAWFPMPLANNAAHPSGRTWGGNNGNYLALIALEGQPPGHHRRVPA